MGKLAAEDLAKMLSCIKKTSQVIVPPKPGFDSGVHTINDDKCVVISTDPCIGVPEEWFGWFLINYTASDVAVFGAKPQYATINLLGPRGTKSAVFEEAMRQACKAADELEIAIITGHTGTYDGLSTLVGTCTAYGIIKQSELITPSGAKARDLLVCVKPLGLETLVNFALTKRKLADRLFGSKKAQQLAQKVEMQTCVTEALALAQTRGVTAMHDATEGGFITALNEIANASKIGFSIDFDKLLILPELRKLAEQFDLSWRQILSTSSTGTLLAAVRPSHKQNATECLSQLHLSSRVVGVFTEENQRTIKLDGEKVDFPEVAADPYAEILG